MNVYLNESYLKAQLDRAGKMRLYGVICLGIAIAAALYFQFVSNASGLVIILSYPFLLAGFPLWTIGNNRLRVLKQTTRADQKLTIELKGFNDKYSLHHYPLINGRMVKHIFIAPSGAVVLESNDTLGPVTCKGDKWKAKTSFLERFGGMNSPIGNPTAELEASRGAVKDLLAAVGKPEVPIKGLIVFARATDITVEDCTYPAVPMNEARSALKNILADMEPEREERTSVSRILTTDDRRKLNAMLAPQSPATAAKPATARPQAKKG